MLNYACSGGERDVRRRGSENQQINVRSDQSSVVEGALASLYSQVRSVRVLVGDPSLLHAGLRGYPLVIRLDDFGPIRIAHLVRWHIRAESDDAD